MLKYVREIKAPCVVVGGSAFWIVLELVEDERHDDFLVTFLEPSGAIWTFPYAGAEMLDVIP